MGRYNIWYTSQPNSIVNLSGKTQFLKFHITLEQINLESTDEDNKLFIDMMW